PTYHPRMKATISLIDNGILDGFSSVIMLTEVLIQPFRNQDTKLAKAYQDILTGSSHFSLLPVSAEIAEYAAQLRPNYTLKTPDALHLATAIKTSCNVFLTNDIRLQRTTEIQVRTLDELEI